MYNEKMNSLQTGDTSPSQYILDEGPHKPMATYVPFSPTSSTSDWWNTLKSEVDSPKDSCCWSSDSESQQTIICGSLNLDDQNNKIRSSASSNNGSSTTSEDTISTKTKKKKSKDAPVANKPYQTVQRRNARERKRVQAVNSAFQNLRKAIPVEENKSKRMSKVKTLQLAIDYINDLQNLLQFTNQHTNEADFLADIFSDLQQQQQQMKLESTDFSFRVPTTFYSQLLSDANNEN